MKVYKFGGASVCSAQGVENLARVVGAEDGPLLVIVSAMGKTTNALEAVVEKFMAGDATGASEALEVSRQYHGDMIRELFGEGLPQVDSLFAQLKALVSGAQPRQEDYDMWYDRIVSYGELLSTTIISAYLNSRGQANRLLDMRECYMTDGRHRDADVHIDKSAPYLKAGMVREKCRLFVGQGFIAGAPDGSTVTLGREGSDYSAAVAGNILDAESVTIWKDVDGILNADPKLFPDTTLIPELTYLDAVELAYSGAQIIHPKTIKPLQNKGIPLYVRPFGDLSKKGSVIKAEIASPVDVPVIIVRRNQVLVSIRPNDLSFVLEDRLGAIFSTLERYNIKPNLVQSSAVNLSLSVDRTRHLPEVEEELRREGYRVVYNDQMEMLTVRGYTPELLTQYGEGDGVFLSQRTRSTLRVVRRTAKA